ncbi:MAG: VWA domain-containing protein [Deltaproteobacteria bacterium]|nr:VWA domain-containing protein [Deltaproteobacteria bacterium]
MTRRLVLLVVLVACGGGPRGGATARRYELGDRLLELTDRMCACTDRACARAVDADMTAWRADASRVDVHPKLRSLAEPAYATCKDRQTGLAIAIVMHGAELWIGNEEVPEIPEDGMRWLGPFIALREAVQEMDLTRFGPHAQGMLVTYADKAIVRMPLGPIAGLPAALGTQRDYYGTTGSELVSGVRRALTELRKVDARRVLIVVGDGSDTDAELARTELAALKQQAREDRVEVHAFVYRSRMSSGPVVIDVLTDRTTKVYAADKVGEGIERVLERLKAR